MLCGQSDVCVTLWIYFGVRECADSARGMGRFVCGLCGRGLRKTVTLRGWAAGPRQETQSRCVASTVPGVKSTFSSVRIFSDDTNN